VSLDKFFVTKNVTLLKKVVKQKSSSFKITDTDLEEYKTTTSPVAQQK
jgi:hypothetical protein